MIIERGRKYSEQADAIEEAFPYHQLADDTVWACIIDH